MGIFAGSSNVLAKSRSGKQILSANQKYWRRPTLRTDLIFNVVKNSRVEISEAKLAEGFDLVDVDWGDSRNTLVYGDAEAVSHYYEEPETVAVRVSNTVSELNVGASPRLVSVDGIGSNVKVLSDGCFNYSTRLSRVSVPSSVQRIGVGCFNGCSSLTELRFYDRDREDIMAMQDYSQWKQDEGEVILIYWSKDGDEDVFAYKDEYAPILTTDRKNAYEFIQTENNDYIEKD